MKVAIIGCGNMGMAYAKSFLQYDLVRRDDLLLVEKNTDRMESLRNANSGVVTGVIDPTLGTYDLLILAVKPQDFNSVASLLRGVLQPTQLILSIMAGISIPTLQEKLNHPLIIRAMPNTPALIGMGMTAFAASKEADNHQIRKVENLINATGRSLFLEDEGLLDAVTALSGSGPAYFFYIVKAMIEAGKEMGFEESMATLLVKQTMLGSFHLINNADKSLEELINAVASKGGTTEAALKKFNEGNLTQTLIEGLRAAERRATELSKG